MRPCVYQPVLVPCSCLSSLLKFVPMFDSLLNEPDLRRAHCARDCNCSGRDAYAPEHRAGAVRREHGLHGFAPLKVYRSTANPFAQAGSDLPWGVCQFTNHADIEAGDERSGIPRPPATASLGEDGLAILLQGDAGSTGWTYEFVPGTPDEQL